MLRFTGFSRRLCASAVFIFFFIHAFAQQPPALFARSFTTNDSVLLRWAPADFETWKAGNKYGYLIQRFSVDPSTDDTTGKGMCITPQPVFPLAKEDSTWNSLMKADNNNAIVYEAAFENNFNNTGDPKKNAVEEKLVLGLALKACDLSVATAKAAGLYFADKHIADGNKYYYLIRVAKNSAGKKQAICFIASEKSASVLNSPGNLRATSGNRSVTLSFDAATTRAQYAGYIIERSADSLHFSRINANLLVFAQSQFEKNKTDLVYTDTVLQNNIPYWYRVRGFSYFGLEGPASVCIKVKSHDQWKMFPVMDTLFSADNKIVQMKFHLEDSSEMKTLKKIIVLRGASSQVNYVNIANLTATGINFSFTDQHPLPADYYLLGAISENNDTAFSYPYFFQLADNDPPPVPKNISGRIDTNGVVHLNWENVIASDLRGYRIFRCNDLHEEFSEVSRAIDTVNSFTDTITLSTLTKNVFYAVRSVDKMWNNSANSQPVRLSRPDKIPPVPVVVISAVHTDSTILLAWINSCSDDVMDVKLYRQSVLEKIALAQWKKNDTLHNFTDTSAVPGTDYSYFIIVTDSSGNSSRTDFPVVHFFPHIFPALQNFTATPDFEKRTITLSWKPQGGNVDRYVIYKAKNGEQLRAWKTLDGNSTMIIDNELYPGNTYIYKVKAILKSGAETKLTGVEVVF